MAKDEELESLNKKERKEYLKTLHSSQSSRQQKLRLLFAGLIIIGIIAAGAGIYLLSESRSKDKIPPVGELVDAMPAPNTAPHINVGDPHVPYSTNPPTSGPHYNQPGYGPIECKVYDDEVQDEGALHSMEHGAVWLTYQDKNDKVLAEQLKKVVDDYSKTLLSPRAANDSKIAVVAWRHILKLDSYDDTKIRNFVRLYKNSAEAPEPLATCGTAMPGS